MWRTFASVIRWICNVTLPFPYLNWTKWFAFSANGYYRICFHRTQISQSYLCLRLFEFYALRCGCFQWVSKSSSMIMSNTILFGTPINDFISSAMFWAWLIGLVACSTLLSFSWLSVDFLAHSKKTLQLYSTYIKSNSFRLDGSVLHKTS